MMRASPKIQEIVSRVLSGSTLTVLECTTLLSARSSVDVALIAQAADNARQRLVGDRVGYVVNRNINFTNTCIKRCGFCAFSRTGANAEAYFLPEEEIVRRAKEAVSLGATEICIQAGLPPNMPPDLYERIASAVKSAEPGVNIHAFSPEEVLYGAKRSKRSVREMLLSLRDAGVDSLPGTSAEILVDEVRKQIAGQRLSTRDWIDVVTTAHDVGLPTSSTMMYGHIEKPHHIAAHLKTIRDVQSATAGFTEFVPLSFVAAEAPMFREGMVKDMRAGPTGREVVLAHAVSRLMLAGSINNVQVSWVKEGKRMAQCLLNQGANDIGGTLMNESISTAAGATHGQLVTPQELKGIIDDIGRQPYERTATYQTVERQGEVCLNHAAAAQFGSFHTLTKSTQWRAKETLRGFGKQQRAFHTSRSISMSQVTYSNSYTIVPTFECYNICTYCNFRQNIGKAGWLSLEKAAETLGRLQGSSVDEILILSGEVHPKARNRIAWHTRILELCRLALEYGFLPHSNVGPLSRPEMESLASVNASMGLMLEQIVPLPSHVRAPSKCPELRLEQLKMAGEIGLPFTTGLLLGLGETPADRLRGLESIADVALRYGHIQEVILQPFSAGERDKWQDADLPQDRRFTSKDLPALVREARSILPSDVSIQVPPNLLHDEDAGQDVLLACLKNGASDLGGISPRDEVNPSYDFPPLENLEHILSMHGFKLKPRLCIHENRLRLLAQDPSRQELYQHVAAMIR
mmetsp:Transcript_158366/g.279476  ORF Transcript_158366/g.279476 Transcript_158366/m.279476 type:complete len:747 (-) Transcript_158366:23-2263(-)